MSKPCNSGFDHFHTRLGKPPFAPDFLDSLARVMADPDSHLDERVLAWSKYFAWGNYSEVAVRIDSDGHASALRQRDCAEDLAWLEAGARVEWLDAPAQIRSLEMSRLGVKPLDKTAISRAFRSNQLHGTIEPKNGHDIRPAVSPKLRTPQNISDPHKVAHSREFREFLGWFRVAHSREWEELELARSTVRRLGRVVLSACRQWRAGQRNAAPSYKPLETENQNDEALREEA